MMATATSTATSVSASVSVSASASAPVSVSAPVSTTTATETTRASRHARQHRGSVIATALLQLQLQLVLVLRWGWMLLAVVRIGLATTGAAAFPVGCSFQSGLVPGKLWSLDPSGGILLGATRKNDNSCNDNSYNENENNCRSPVWTHSLTSKSGLPVCRYALGGAARSTQPEELPAAYCNAVAAFGQDADNDNDNDNDNNRNDNDNDNNRNDNDNDNDNDNRKTRKSPSVAAAAPFLFYYNPHRYPDFMRGVSDLADGQEDSPNREDLFLASGGTDFSTRGMEDRLSDALAYSGGDYLDLFVLEYVCPGELGGDNDNDGNDNDNDGNDNNEVVRALRLARSWIREGRVRYVAASTHSHAVGAQLASLSLADHETENGKEDLPRPRPMLDAIMLRYNMAHATAAEALSFPVCSLRSLPVLAFTTTRWNRLQEGHPDWPTDKPVPTTPDCLEFALRGKWNRDTRERMTTTTTTTMEDDSGEWPIEIALHSARTVDELHEAMECLASPSYSAPSPLPSPEAATLWRDYGALNWNDKDGFDEYPEEQR